MPTVREIVALTARAYDLPPDMLKSHRRSQELVQPRHVACYLAKKYTTASFPQIGKALGNRDHTTVMHAVKKIDALLAHNPELRRMTGLLEAAIVCDIRTTDAGPGTGVETDDQMVLPFFDAACREGARGTMLLRNQGSLPASPPDEALPSPVISALIIFLRHYKRSPDQPHLGPSGDNAAHNLMAVCDRLNLYRVMIPEPPRQPIERALMTFLSAERARARAAWTILERNATTRRDHAAQALFQACFNHRFIQSKLQSKLKDKKS